jgi:hypothetical protein
MVRNNSKIRARGAPGHAGNSVGGRYGLQEEYDEEVTALYRNSMRRFAQSHRHVR